MIPLKISRIQFIFLLVAASVFIVSISFTVKKFILTPKTASVPDAAKKISIPCPVPASFCQQAVPVTYKGQTIGLGFSLPFETPITAVFEGILEEGSEAGGPLQIKAHPVRWLHGKNEFADYIATYSFYGQAASAYGEDKMVKLFDKGDKVAITDSETFPEEEPFNKVNFIFSVTKGDKFSEPVDFLFE